MSAGSLTEIIEPDRELLPDINRNKQKKLVLESYSTEFNKKNGGE